MQTVSAGLKIDLLERYPELLLSLNFAEQVGAEALHGEESPQEIGRFLKKHALEGVEILYLYGIGSGAHYRALKSWLHAQRSRRLVFVEDELPAICALLATEAAEELLTDPQVLLHYIPDLKQLGSSLDELVAQFPCDRIEVACLESRQKRKGRLFRKIRLKLLRQSGAMHAIHTEALYAHKLLGNLLRNIWRWDGSFFASGLKGKFRGIPAIICGAGPSLQKNLPLLKTLEDRALIIAGGSSLAALSNQGIPPHLGLALDPNTEEFHRLKIASAYETPLIYATRLQPDVFNAVSGERGYLVTSTGGPCEHYFEKEMGLDAEPTGPELGMEALSVTTLAIAFAVEMGCNPILLDGIDLSYTGMRRYADGILPSSQIDPGQMRQNKNALERPLKRKNIHGDLVHTLVRWVMESDCIAAFAKAHPQTRFINVSAGGIGFAGIPNLPLERAMEEVDFPPVDLRALVHAMIQPLKLPPLEERIAAEMQAIHDSLVRLKRLAQEMLGELRRVRDLVDLQEVELPTGKMVILEIDFQEEIAFECLFTTLGPALDRLLSRAFFAAPSSSETEKQRFLIDGKIAKWEQWKEMIESEIVLFAGAVSG